MHSPFHSYQTKFLFLLIGENSLPNYVAVKLLLAAGGTIYLISSNETYYSRGTSDQSDRLRELLAAQDINVQQIFLDDSTNAYQIRVEIEKRLIHLNGSIGLHYSSGTKPMAIHAYRALLDHGENSSAPLVFSYLDSQRIQLCVDRPDDNTIYIPVTPQHLSVNLETIFCLYRNVSGQQLKFDRQLKLPTLANALAIVNAEKTTAQQWFDWFIKDFSQGGGDGSEGNKAKAARKPKKNGRGRWKSKSALKELTFSMKTLPITLLNAFETTGFLNAANELSFASYAEGNCFRKPEDLCKWLDGLWLEHYVLQAVVNLSKKFPSVDYGISFDFDLKGTKDGFEFDVAFTYGYQLFAISCTTYGDLDGQRGGCKLKLLEAYIRAQQMGGTEARVALVCLADDPDSLKSELADSVGKSKVRVFGREQLLTLETEIERWIKNNDAELKR